MAYFLVQLFLNTIVISVTIFILPSVHVESGGLLTYLLLGGLFGLLNAFIRPIVVFMTGRIAIRTLGLSQIFVHSVMFWLLSEVVNWMAPGVLVVGSAWAALFSGLVIGGLMVFLDIILGLNRPMLDEIEQNPIYLTWFNGLPSERGERIVETLRFQTVYDILWRYGMEILANNSPLWRVRAWVEHLRNPHVEHIDIPSTPKQVRIMLQQLGPTYVKIGQMISSRSNSMPEEWQVELAKLQSNVPTFPTSEAIRIIETSLGKPVKELFVTFSEEPLAAASTAQIHRATLPTGQQVVVKVRRPNILVKVRADLGIIKQVIESLEKRFEAVRNADASSIFHEFATNVMKELDYRNELFNARHLAKQLEGLEGVRVPEVFGALSSDGVLVMSFEKGVKITDIAALEAADIDRTALAKRYIGAMAKQIVFDGFFHGDPHPGNILVDTRSGDIVFLDMGMMGELGPEQRLDLLDILWSIHRQDGHGLAKVLLRLSTRFKTVDEATFIRQVERLIERYLVFADENQTISTVLDATLDMMNESGLRMNSDMTLALKAIAQSEEILTRLDPRLSLVTTIIEELKAIFLNSGLDLSKVASALGAQLVSLVKEAALELPGYGLATRSWLQQYRKGELRINIDTQTLDKELSALSSSLNLVMVGLLLLGMIGGSAAASFVSTSVFGVSLSLVAFVIFILAMGFSFVIAWRMVRRSQVDG